jgi:hypothetical protein
MFYTIISRIPQVYNNNNKNKLAYIFIIGSVVYVILHYYLFTINNNLTIDKLKMYIYYAILFDFICLLTMFYFKKNNISNDNNNNNDDDNNDNDINNKIEKHEDSTYVKSQIEQLKDEKSNASITSPFKKRNESDDNNDKKNKKQHKTTSKSDSPSNEKNKQNKKQKKSKKQTSSENNETDIHLPLFDGDN